MSTITQDMIDCWRINYVLDKRSPEDAMRWWAMHHDGKAPAGAVAALGLVLNELDALRKQCRNLEAHPAHLQGLRFAGWFAETPSAMSYRLWEQGGHERDPDVNEVALYEVVP